MVKSTIQVTLFSLLGIAINFSLQLLMAYYFGAGSDRDAYFLSLTIPTYVAVLFTGSVGMMLLPNLVHYHAHHSEEDTVRFMSSILNFCFVVLVVVAIAGFLLAAPLMEIMMPSSRAGMLKTSILLFRIQIIAMLFTVMSNLLAPVFQAKHSFLIPSLFPIITSLCTVFFVACFSSSLGINGVALGALTGSVISFLFMLVLALKQYRYRWSFSIRWIDMSGLLYASMPLFIAGILFRSATVFERFFAARLPQGSLSYLGTGNQIVVILSTIVSSGIATTSFPLFSKYWATKDLRQLEKAFTRVISLVLFIVFPLIVVFAITGVDIIHLVFERGAFTATDSAALYYTLLGLMGFFLFSSMGNVVMKILYLSKRTIAVAVIGTVELVIYIVIALLLIRSLQYVGLALSLSVASACNVIATFIFIKKKILDLDMGILLRRLARIVFSSVCIFLLFFLVNRYFLGSVNSIARIAIISCVVFLSYGLLMFRMLKEIGYQKIFTFLN